MALGIFSVSPELLAQCLHLPAGAEICQVNGDARNVEIIVSHPDIKPDGSSPARVLPSFRRQDEVVFVGWGQ